MKLLRSLVLLRSWLNPLCAHTAPLKDEAGEEGAGPSAPYPPARHLPSALAALGAAGFTVPAISRAGDTQD